MATENNSHTVPDALLERYLSGELPSSGRRKVEAGLAANPAWQKRLHQLSEEREKFYTSHSANAFAQRVHARLQHEKAVSKPWWLWFGAPSLATAAVALLVFVVHEKTPQREIDLVPALSPAAPRADDTAAANAPVAGAPAADAPAANALAATEPADNAPADNAPAENVPAENVMKDAMPAEEGQVAAKAASSAAAQPMPRAADVSEAKRRKAARTDASERDEERRELSKVSPLQGIGSGSGGVGFGAGGARGAPAAPAASSAPPAAAPAPSHAAPAVAAPAPPSAEKEAASPARAFSLRKAKKVLASPLRTSSRADFVLTMRRMDASIDGDYSEDIFLQLHFPYAGYVWGYVVDANARLQNLPEVAASGTTRVGPSDAAHPIEWKLSRRDVRWVIVLLSQTSANEERARSAALNALSQVRKASNAPEGEAGANADSVSEPGVRLSRVLDFDLAVLELR